MGRSQNTDNYNLQTLNTILNIYERKGTDFYVIIVYLCPWQYLTARNDVNFIDKM